MGTDLHTNANTLMQTLPGDDIRQVMWRYADRYDIQMLIQAARAVARGPVARAVAEGARNSHEWTPLKNGLLQHFDESGITGAFLDPEYGGIIEGSKNLAFGLIAFELGWVDAGAATCSLAGNLAYAPIHERGTAEQYAEYMRRMAPTNEQGPLRGAFALTEPLPYVGVDTGAVAGRVRVAEWVEGSEPVLHVEKRGRFITNMDFAQFVTAAVESDDPRIKGSCMVILEETDPGTWDRGAATRKMVHQLSSTRDPVLSVRVPAHRIIGGYTVKDGVIIPNYSHGDVIEAVFRRTRVTVGLITAAKLLSAIEPVIRYQRSRFRGGVGVNPGTPRHELGIQQREDALLRLIDVWSAGEAAASLGFETARVYDVLDPLEKQKDALLAEKGVKGGWAQMREFKKRMPDALEYVRLATLPEAEHDAARFAELEADAVVQFMTLDAVANVLCPATKLWNTGYGANMMREALSLMGGYGITEDCPGFLPMKWADAQLEATYEGPECVQRRQMSITMAMDLFLAQFRTWIVQARGLAASGDGIGAGAIAAGMELWLWTLEHVQQSTDADGAKLFTSARQGVSFPLADALCWLLAARQLMLDVIELETRGPEAAVDPDGLRGTVSFMQDLCHVQAAKAAGETGRICAELVYGYQRGVEPAAREAFSALRDGVDQALAGSRLAKDRAAAALAQVMIPEALDYPRA